MTSPRWPDDWNERLAGKHCPMCRSLRGGDNEYWVHVSDRRFAVIALERRSRLPGYCIAMWNGQHVAEPTDLPPDQAAGYWADVLAVGRAVQAVFRPVKLNYMTLGNTVPHLHTHVVPRYRDDPAPAGPIPWDAMFTSDPVDEEQLQRQASHLRGLL